MAKPLQDDYSDAPKHRGLLAIVPEIREARNLAVTIIGDSDGLAYLAEMLQYFADLDVEERQMPDGARAHFPLRPGLQIVEYSCDVEICRADAKGTGDYPYYFSALLSKQTSKKQRGSSRKGNKRK